MFFAYSTHTLQAYDRLSSIGSTASWTQRLPQWACGLLQPVILQFFFLLEQFKANQAIPKLAEEKIKDKQGYMLQLVWNFWDMIFQRKEDTLQSYFFPNSI